MCQVREWRSERLRGREIGLRGGESVLSLADTQRHMTGFGDEKASKKKKPKPKSNSRIGGENFLRNAINHHKRGDLANAEKSYREAIKSNYCHPSIFSNLGIICKNSGRLEEAISLYSKAIEINPTDHELYSSIGNVYIKTGNYDLALKHILKCLELDSRNPAAIHNIKALLDRMTHSQSNEQDLRQAYELVLNQTNVSHRKLSGKFLKAFLPKILKTSSSDPIIADNNKALHTLLTDWTFLKSITLLIPLSAEAEEFFTKLRKELLTLTTKESIIPQQIKRLTEALAAQCFLNEYVYSTSQEEEESVAQIIDAAAYSQEAVNRYLAIIGCYKAIHKTDINPKLINNYPIVDNISRELIAAQFTEPNHEKEIKALFQEPYNNIDKVSRKVQEMYEENPYPRYKYSNYTARELATPISRCIKLEMTKQNQFFTEDLISQSISPKVLIAGCGTGNQVIMASRYKNARITAIDLSSSSLAYAIRKAIEYKMDNIIFKKMDILNSPKLLGQMFDVIECSGVLHHMAQPAEGLSALAQQLKPGGYIKIGLYSETARKQIVEARKLIKKLGVASTTEGIRHFRKKVMDGEIEGLLNLPKFVGDFYSLSDCRDLCFHVQEHRFTTESLKKLVDSHGLTFCGFMVTEQIKKIYQEQYPEDIDMTSLPNWGKLEEEHPSTFAGMYQFWAQKPS